MSELRASPEGELAVWSFHRGFVFDQDNTVRFTAVHNREAMTHGLGYGPTARRIRADIRPLLDHVPFDLTYDYDTWFRVLGWLRDGKGFDYEVNP